MAMTHIRQGHARSFCHLMPTQLKEATLHDLDQVIVWRKKIVTVIQKVIMLSDPNLYNPSIITFLL